MGFIKSTSGAAAIILGVLTITAWILVARDKSYGDSSRRCHGCVQYIHEQIKNYPDSLRNLDPNDPDTTIPDEGKSWLRGFRNPYPILISFACILCVLWMVTGFIGLTSKSTSEYIIFVMLAGLSYVIFAIVFGILVDRFDHINYSVDTYAHAYAIEVPDIASMKQEHYTIDNIFVMGCLQWCYKGEANLIKDYMLPNVGVYEADIGNNLVELGKYVQRSWLLKHIMDSWDIFWGSSLACFLLGAYVIAGSIYTYNTEKNYMPQKA
eukprot:TRINITY_DN9580_c0_g2_i10.p1 TRINITY_DN9580_c0_g2~~TRINITY_DN9580_c0_g2_i10.p1  ORF type:complete len:266 (-),score=32.09 TRINITY_DN9580_c0_g2_i10:165-962(-)